MIRRTKLRINARKSWFTYTKTVKLLFITYLTDMENYYEILGCSPSSSPQEVKRSFQQLALQHHPDKLSKSRTADVKNETSADSKFVQISRAWTVLANADSRREYDAAWHQRCVAQDLPVQDVVNIEEFTADETCAFFVYPCRCGADYELTSQQVSYRVDYVSCPSCSLCIMLQYS